ncbi:GNA1162 family protein [Gaoshiqia sp. Z1-71]|uniref:GNA1162 family protein n=1 Tax=Gaoshiqia hydrogeniformans TaxID=3290090 RepID=UPI003BF8EC0E
MKNLLYFVVAAAMLASCSNAKLLPKSEAYKNIYQEKPLSVLLLPPINRSTKVEAKELFYSSLSQPLTLRGYYVMPPLLSMEILKEESAYDAELFINNSMKQVGDLFGVDAVLFTTIHEWNKTAIASQINVKIEYLLKSARTDEILFHRTGDITLNVSVNTGSIIGNVVGSMLATALTKEIVVARNCNYYTVTDIPSGKYSPTFGLDGDLKAQPAEFKQVLKNQY